MNRCAVWSTAVSVHPGILTYGRMCTCPGWSLRAVLTLLANLETSLGRLLRLAPTGALKKSSLPVSTG